MNFAIKKEILDLFEKQEFYGVTEIAEVLGKNRVVIQRYLKKLIEVGILEKINNGPKTKYKKIFSKGEKKIFEDKKKKLDDKKFFNPDFRLDFKMEKILEENFWKFSPEGRILKGLSGLQEWCFARNLDFEEKIKTFINTFNYIEDLQDNCGLLDAKENFGMHFEKVYLDEIFYADQYKWMEFGRGKLAEMTFYAKQSQDKKLIFDSINQMILKLKCVILKGGFDAIAITPWSIDRKNQILHLLKKDLEFLGLPFVNIVKYYPNKIPIPQKSLKIREQRIQNARNTIFIDDKNISKYKKVFLIDDFVGSGSTLNETACKLKNEGVEFVTGFAFVGNLDLKYDVINEV